MKEKIIKVPRYVYVAKVDGEVDSVEYISDDGKSFGNKNDCMKYEAELKRTKILKESESFIKKIEIEDGSEEDILIQLCLEYDDASIDYVFKWKGSSDINDQNKLNEVLAGYIHYGLNLSGIVDGEYYIIVSYTIGYYSDYPSYETEILSYDDFNKKILALQNGLTKLFA